MDKWLVIIRIHGSIEIQELKGKPTINQMQGLIGGHLTSVPVKVNGHMWQMFYNKISHIFGYPPNKVAASLATFYHKRFRPVTGDAVILVGYKLKI
jgi:hypothetical protein